MTLIAMVPLTALVVGARTDLLKNGQDVGTTCSWSWLKGGPLLGHKLIVPVRESRD